MVLLTCVNNTASWLWFGGKGSATNSDTRLPRLPPSCSGPSNVLFPNPAVSSLASSMICTRISSHSISDSKLSSREWSINQCLYACISPSESFSFAVGLCCVSLKLLTWPTVFQCYTNSFEYTLTVLQPATQSSQVFNLQTPLSSILLF